VIICPAAASVMENDSEISMSRAIGMNSDVLKINAAIVMPSSAIY